MVSCLFRQPAAFRCFCVLAAAFGIAGCSGGNAESLYKVSGTVTYNGKPVPNVSVIFNPEGDAGSGRSGTAITDENGAFSSVTTHNPGDGVIPGKQTVTLATIAKEGDSGDLGEDAYGTGDASELPFPTKYLNSTESDIHLDITSSGQTVEIKLTD